LKKQTVGVNSFVRRQVKGSGKSYSFDLAFEKIAVHAENRLNFPGDHIVPGYRDGVCLVSADRSFVNSFYCPLIKIKPTTELRAVFTKRRKKENSYIQIRAVAGDPLPASRVDFILYRHDVLAENNEQSTDMDWELVSFNAIPKEIEKMPMGFVTMMRNQLCLPGGTRARYSTEEWAESVLFWQKYAFLLENK
jgi:hypothetical protein